jgi:succinate dehydrogenase/fumarate reductase flavoprotein subunit
MSGTYLEPAKEIDVYGEFDVIVVGGGVAGWSAAVAAGRAGADVLIIERFPYFGGTATASLMANIVGIRNQVKPDGLQAMRGIGE